MSELRGPTTEELRARVLAHEQAAPPVCRSCKGRGEITYFPPRRDGAYPIRCPECSAPPDALALDSEGAERQ